MLISALRLHCQLSLFWLFSNHFLYQLNAKTDIFTSTARMEYILRIERDLASLLKGYIVSMEQQLKGIKQFSEITSRVYQDHSLKQLIGNPIFALTALRRAGYDWKQTVEKIKMMSTLGNDLTELLRRHYSDLPTKNDVKGAAEAILRLQDTYRLNAVSFTEKASTPSFTLHLDDIYSIGRSAYKLGKMEKTKEWMELALEKLHQDDTRMVSTKQSSKHGINSNNFVGNNINYEVDVRDHLAFSSYRLGNMQEAYNYTMDILKEDPTNEKAITNQIHIESVIKGKSKAIIQQKYKLNFEQELFKSLCREEMAKNIPRKSKRKSRLKCSYANHHPTLKIKPIKVEQLTVEPEVYLYHQIVSESEIRIIKSIAHPKLKRSRINNIDTGVSETAKYRISETGWISDQDNETVQKISQRLESITGLNTLTAEDIQVANYGIGGHYDPHYDWSLNFNTSALKKLGVGNRIATVLIYLNDVDAGGGTAFIHPRLTVLPQKGSALFWYNLYKNGTGKINTQHAACPVLFGTKWVANKWFHERGQEFRRPCSLKRNE